MKNIFIVLAIILTSLYSVDMQAQSRLEILGVDPSNYPAMQAEVKVFNNAGEDMRSFLRPENFIINDGGEIKPANDIECDDNRLKMSLIITLDVSTSMVNRAKPEFSNRTGKDVAEIAIRNFINQFPENTGEIAITTFSSGEGGYIATRVHREFSEDKQDLLASLNEIGYNGRTNYNKAILGDTLVTGRDLPNGEPEIFIRDGVIQLAERARYSVFNLFITDGAHSEGALKEVEMTNELNARNIKLYPISLGLPLPGELESIARATGGNADAGSNLTNESEFESFFQLLLSDATQIANPSPCILTWDANCSGGELDITYNDYGNPSAQESYIIPPDRLPIVELPVAFGGSIDFYNQGFDAPTTVSIPFTARKNNYNLEDIEIGDPRFEIVGNTNYVIQQDQTVDIDIRLTTSIRECINTDITFKSEGCDYTFPLNANFAYIEAVDVGSTTIGEELTYTQTDAFCNYTNQRLTADFPTIFGGNAASEFDIITQFPIDIEPCECIDIEYAFNPSTTGVRSSEYSLTVGGQIFEAPITGAGGGAAQIAAEWPTPIPTGNCELASNTVQVEVFNNGPVELQITDVSIEGPDADDFRDPTVVLWTADPNGSTFIEVSTNIQDVTVFGQRNAELVIVNNSDNAPEFRLPISVYINEVEIQTDIQEIDFGVLCPGENVSETITITNTAISKGEFSVYPEVNNNYYTLSTDEFFLPDGGSETITVNFGTNDVGTYDGQVSLVDACARVIPVTLRATVSNPELEIVSGDQLSSGIGEITASDLVVRNNSEHILTIIGGNISDTEITFIDDPATNNITIQPNQTAAIPLEYLPLANTLITPNITLQTDKCGYTFTGTLEAQPGVLDGELIVSDAQARVGERFNLNLDFTNKTPGFEVLTTDRISFDLTYDSRYCEFVNMPGVNATETIDATNFATLSVIDYPIDNLDNDPIILDFIAKQGLVGADITPMIIENATAEGFIISLSNANLEIIRSFANIEINDYSVSTGNTITYPILITDENGDLQDFHQGFTGTIEYNPLVLSPIGENFDITYNQDYSVATMTFEESINFANDQASKNPTIQNTRQFQIMSIDFRALYGNERTTEIKVKDVESIAGEVEIDNSSSNVTIEDICDYGNDEYRFLELSPTATPINVSALAESPNQVTINAATVESVVHTLSIYNTNGQLVYTQEGFGVPGRHSLNLNGQTFTTGSYFVILKGLTNSATSRFVITK
jgi:hypothetical protein